MSAALAAAATCARRASFTTEVSQPRSAQLNLSNPTLRESRPGGRISSRPSCAARPEHQIVEEVGARTVALALRGTVCRRISIVVVEANPPACCRDSRHANREERDGDSCAGASKVKRSSNKGYEQGAAIDQTCSASGRGRAQRHGLRLSDSTERYLAIGPTSKAVPVSRRYRRPPVLQALSLS